MTYRGPRNSEGGARRWITQQRDEPCNGKYNCNTPYTCACLHEAWMKNKKERKTMLDRFRAALDERLSFEELVELYTYGKSYVATYAELSMPAPDWAAEQVKKLRDALVQRRKDTLEKQLAQAKGKMETLKTAEQKREDAAAEIARLEALLAGQ